MKCIIKAHYALGYEYNPRIERLAFITPKYKDSSVWYKTVYVDIEPVSVTFETLYFAVSADQEDPDIYMLEEDQFNVYGT